MRRVLFLAALLFLELPVSDASAADAEAIWKRRCTGCHRADGTGHTGASEHRKVPDLTSAHFQASNTDAHLREIIANGIPDTRMPSFKDRLSSDEISSLVAYIRKLKKD